eukprot:gb/GECH01012954.1/.p1 GENE.gb/GECH01012954.1/~~gb/GECH01012954.1/.p1  ORF type:complete len:306 (+),score=98.45 gb/GECH01012954.1/:1-918(+)
MSDQPKPLHSDLLAQLKTVREKRNFHAQEWIDKKTQVFNDYMKRCNLKSCVVSVSGGVDSAVTLAIAIEASKKEGSPIEKVIGVAQPIHSTASIWKRAFEMKNDDDNILSIVTVDQTDIHTQLTQIVQESMKGIIEQDKPDAFSSGQLKSYMRTPVAFYIAQLMSQQRQLPCIVLGTGNMDEDGYLYYFCKAGDGVADVQLIADLHKSEVFQVGRCLNVPESILGAPPSADLWDGQTDENELGFGYDFVELLTEYFKLNDEEKKDFQAQLSSEAQEQFQDLSAKAEKVHRRNSHKANFPLDLNVL